MAQPMPKYCWKRTKFAQARNDYNIADEHLADAIELLVERYQQTLSPDRDVKDPYHEKPPVWD